MRLDHRIFKGPLNPLLDFTSLETPENYSHYPAGKDLPKSLNAWLVQTEAFPDMQPGLVADSFGFTDSPDAEWISGGTNSKGPTSLALGRQGNLFMWGFFADPQHMTESGRRVFLNSVVYISKFKNARPLVARKAPARERVFLYMHYVRERKDHERTQEIVDQLFPADLLERTQYDADAMIEHYEQHLEFLHRKGGRFVVDADAMEIGISNRSLDFLDALATRLDTDVFDPLALRLLKRYVDSAIAPAPGTFSQWLARNKSTLYFSDVGGFKWFSPTAPSQPNEETVGQKISLALSAQPRVLSAGDSTEWVLKLTLSDGWHTYSPASKGGFPIAVTFDWPAGVTPSGEVQAPAGHIVLDPVLGSMEEISGTIEIRQKVEIGPELPAGAISIPCKVTVTICDALQCLPPQTIDLEMELTVASH